jgi:hypothetical protein
MITDILPSIELLWTSDWLDADTSTRQHTSPTKDRPPLDNTYHPQKTDLHLTTHNTHNKQTSTWQHTTLTTDSPLHDNTQHSQQTDLYLTTHNTHNRQSSTWQHTTLTTHIPLPDNTQHSNNTQTSTWQHTTLTTHRTLPDNTQHSNNTQTQCSLNTIYFQRNAKCPIQAAKAITLQAWTDPEGSSIWKHTDFMTIGTWML